jgi:hypothetical protein
MSTLGVERGIQESLVTSRSLEYGLRAEGCLLQLNGSAHKFVDRVDRNYEHEYSTKIEHYATSCDSRSSLGVVSAGLRLSQLLHASHCYADGVSPVALVLVASVFVS